MQDLVDNGEVSSEREYYVSGDPIGYTEKFNLDFKKIDIKNHQDIS